MVVEVTAMGVGSSSSSSSSVLCVLLAVHHPASYLRHSTQSNPSSPYPLSLPTSPPHLLLPPRCPTGPSSASPPRLC